MSDKELSDDEFPQVWDFKEWLEKRRELEVMQLMIIDDWFLRRHEKEKKEKEE